MDLVNKILSIILLLLLISTVSEKVNAQDSLICINSKYYKKKCYKYFPYENESSIRTILYAYDEYDSLVLKILSVDSLPADDVEYSEKNNNVTGWRSIYDRKHRLLQEIRFPELYRNQTILLYHYRIFSSCKIRKVKYYRGIYPEKRKYQYIGCVTYSYKYEPEFIIMKIFDVNESGKKIFNKYIIIYK